MSAKHAILYFQPGQLLFHAQGNLVNQAQLDGLMQWAKELAATKGITLSATATLNDVLYFDTSQQGPYFKRGRLNSAEPTNKTPIIVGPSRPEGGLRGPVYTSPEVKIPPPFSLAFVNVVSDRWAPLPVPANPDEQLQLSDDQLEAHTKGQNELLDLAHFLDKRRSSAPVKLEVVSLVWITSGGSEPGGTGGPGGPPEHVSNADIGKYHLYPASTSLPPAFNTVSQPSGGNGVVVAMLDTAYEPDELTAIYDQWVVNPPAPLAPNPIIAALLGPNGCLTVHNDINARDCLGGVTLPGYDYVMKSHSLYGAGGIHYVAPEADIHVYQALNQYCLGDTRIIIENLARIIMDFAGRPLVIAAPLTFRRPETEEDLEDNDDYGMGQSILNHRPPFLIRLICWVVCWIFESLLRLPCPGFCESWLERQARPFEWLSDLVYLMNSRVIAAAGNDSKGGRSRHPARYPAASDSVLGVGALGNNGAPAPYSNLADRPPRIGLTTLGGDRTKGILGAYADPFPGPQPKNENGMCLWCGSSFATDNMAGIVAAVLSNLISTRSGTGRIPTTEDAIVEVYNAQSLRTSDTEDVFQLEQR